MMNQLLYNTESAAKSLVERVGKWNIGNIQGEEVTKVMSQIASAINQLKQIRKLPQDMVTTLLTIIPTSSVDDFNKVFAAKEAQKKRDDLNQSLTASVKCFNYTSADILSVPRRNTLSSSRKYSGREPPQKDKTQYSLHNSELR
jgi:hypothetical protein